MTWTTFVASFFDLFQLDFSEMCHRQVLSQNVAAVHPTSDNKRIGSSRQSTEREPSFAFKQNKPKLVHRGRSQN